MSLTWWIVISWTLRRISCLLPHPPPQVPPRLLVLEKERKLSHLLHSQEREEKKERP